MARIKYVLNERRLAYAGALAAQAEERDASLANIEVRKERTEFERKALARALREREAKAAPPKEDAPAAGAAA
jgi:hypothetical protein